MNVFSWSRFQRLFLNDLKIQGRKILLASAGAIGLGVFLYLIMISGQGDEVLALYRPMFTIGLLLGGFVLTGMIFSDMHHPVERYFYLMQPVSNFERLLSRYLISGPLFYLYFVGLYFLFEIIARFFAISLMDRSSQFFDFGDPEIRQASLTFLAVHVVVLLGAVYFRSYALVKTNVALAAFALVCGIVLWLSMRIAFWEYFPSLFALVPREEPGTSFNPAAWPSYIYWTIATGLYLWVLFIAYATLQDHEA